MNSVGIFNEKLLFISILKIVEFCGNFWDYRAIIRMILVSRERVNFFFFREFIFNSRKDFILKMRGFNERTRNIGILSRFNPDGTKKIASQEKH